MDIRFYCLACGKPIGPLASTTAGYQPCSCGCASITTDPDAHIKIKLAPKAEIAVAVAEARKPLRDRIDRLLAALVDAPHAERATVFVPPPRSRWLRWLPKRRPAPESMVPASYECATGCIACRFEAGEFKS